MNYKESQILLKFYQDTFQDEEHDSLEVVVDYKLEAAREFLDAGFECLSGSK